MVKVISSQEPKNREIKSEEAKKPVNLRANVMPSDGFVLQVDGKFKTRYENSEEALAAGTKLKRSYPVIQVAIYDVVERIYTPLDVQEPDK